MPIGQPVSPEATPHIQLQGSHPFFADIRQSICSTSALKSRRLDGTPLVDGSFGRANKIKKLAWNLR
jgi:hypothetical protein